MSKQDKKDGTLFPFVTHVSHLHALSVFLKRGNFTFKEKTSLRIESDSLRVCVLYIFEPKSQYDKKKRRWDNKERQEIENAAITKSQAHQAVKISSRHDKKDKALILS